MFLRKGALVLLLCSGVVLGIPAVYDAIFIDGIPWIQLVLGWISVVIAVVLLFSEKKEQV